MRIRGVNFGGWFSQVDCIEEKDPDRFPGVLAHMASFLGNVDFERVKSVGFDHVRLPVDYFNFFKGDDLVPDEDAFALLTHALEMGGRRGLDVILDLHKCPGHDFHGASKRQQAFFSDPRCRQDAKRVWSVLCERYGHLEHVSLEILNEPVAPDPQTWNRVKDEMFVHIRSRAPKSRIVVGSNRWNSADQFEFLTPVDDDNVLYSFHCYNPVIFTHQLAPWLDSEMFRHERSWPGVYPEPARLDIDLPLHFGAWDASRLEQSLEAALTFRARYDVPVACNEFGVFAAVRREDRMRWLRDFMDILRRADVGYSYWNYKNLDFGIVSDGERLHAGNPEYSRNPEHLDVELLELLARG